MRLIFTIILLSIVGVRAATITTNNSVASVQGAINASSDGDTVIVQSGTSIWASTVTCTKGITLQGSGIGNTIIVNGGGVVLSCNSGNKRLTLTGFTFRDGSGGVSEGFISIGGTFWRVCTNRFEGLILTGLKVDGNAWGVVDHCTFQTSTGNSTETGIDFVGDENAWTTNFNWGTTNCAVVEDCVFDFGGNGGHNGGTDGYSGCNFVIRHCMMTNANISNHGADEGGSVYRRSAQSYEAYSNTMVLTIDTEPWTIQTRGGSALAYGNTTINTSGSIRGSWLGIQYFRAEPPPSGGGCFNKNISFGYMELVNGGTPNQFDGNTNSTGWPGLDQPGRVGPTTGYTPGGTPTGNSHVGQKSLPMYSWNNTWNGSSVDWALSQCGNMTFMQQVVQSGRDYFNGVSAPNYTPLVYPHPLVGGGGTGAPTITSNPTAVTNFSGSTLSLSVSASGSPTLTYQWRQNTNSVSGQTSAGFGSNNVQTSSSGWYDCVVTNGSGSVTSSVVYVQITNAPPRIITQPTGQTVSVGDPISVSTIASGSPTLAYQWNFNAAAIPGATSSSYTTNNAQVSNSGSYTCTVTNAYGSITTSVAAVTVQLDLSPHVAAWWTNSALAFNSYTTAVIVSGSKPMLVAFVDSYSAGGNKVTNVTFNGSNMTQLFRTNYFSSNGAMDIWYAANPSAVSANVIAFGTSVAESLIIVVLATNAPSSWALFEPPQANYYASPSVTLSDSINQQSTVNELVLDAVVSASSSYTPSPSQSLITRVTQSTDTVLQSSWNRSLGVYTPMAWTSSFGDTLTHVSVAIKQALPTALPTKLTISNIKVQGRVTIP